MKENAISMPELRFLQSLPLEDKERISKERIREWFDYWEGRVYVSFSGGKDSTVLLHLVRSIYPETFGAFCNTGLEYPEILSFVKTFKRIVWLRPTKRFKDILTEDGYPIISKYVARYLSDLQNKSIKNTKTVHLRLTGYNSAGHYSPSMKLPKKWHYLIDSGIKISSSCCYYMKKEPLKNFHNAYNLKAFVGTLAVESFYREKQYLTQGCNAFTQKTDPISMPIAFWTEEDVKEYITKHNIKISDIYKTEKRTGCMFCMFGVHLEKEPNRFQRMKESHPKHYKYCIEKLQIGKVLDILKVNY